MQHPRGEIVSEIRAIAEKVPGVRPSKSYSSDEQAWCTMRSFMCRRIRRSRCTTPMLWAAQLKPRFRRHFLNVSRVVVHMEPFVDSDLPNFNDRDRAKLSGGSARNLRGDPVRCGNHRKGAPNFGACSPGASGRRNGFAGIHG